MSPANQNRNPTDRCLSENARYVTGVTLASNAKLPGADIDIVGAHRLIVASCGAHSDILAAGRVAKERIYTDGGVFATGGVGAKGTTAHGRVGISCVV